MSWLFRIFKRKENRSQPAKDTGDWTTQVWYNTDSNKLMGLPPAMQKMIRQAGLTDAEIARNPEVMLICLCFQSGLSDFPVLVRRSGSATGASESASVSAPTSEVLQEEPVPESSAPKLQIEVPAPVSEPKAASPPSTPRGGGFNIQLEPEQSELFYMDNPKKVYSDWKQIGEGGFGEVFIAEDIETKKKVAIKVTIKKKGVALDLDPLVNEIHIMKTCSHPNIVNYITSYLYREQVYVIMEYLDGGTLSQMLQHVTLDEGQIAAICLQILQGLAYLHGLNRIHRDLKSDNILLGSEGLVKIADLGLCTQMDDSETGASKSAIAGTPYWMAPEMIQHRGYDMKVDLWSLGSIIYEMAEGKPPYIDFRPLKALFKIAVDGAPPLSNRTKWSGHFLGFFGIFSEIDPKKRTTAAAALEVEYNAFLLFFIQLNPRALKCLNCIYKYHNTSTRSWLLPAVGRT